MNVISNIWNGRAGLAKTYWLWGVLSGIPWGIALSLVKPGSNPAILAVLTFVMYYVIVHVGIWRAASQYQGTKAWAILAKVAVAITPVCLVIGTLAAIIIPATHQSSRQGQQTTPATQPWGANDKSVSAASASPHPSGSFTYEEAIGQQSEKKIEQTPAVSSAAVNWSDFTPVPKPSSAPPVPSAQEVHMQRIYAVHPDANEIYMSAEFTRWLTRTPKFKHVPADGTTQEVIDMFSAYKRRSKAENQRLDQSIERRNDAAAEALARQSACQYKTVMTDDDYFACGVNPPSHLQN